MQFLAVVSSFLLFQASGIGTSSPRSNAGRALHARSWPLRVVGVQQGSSVEREWEWSGCLRDWVAQDPPLESGAVMCVLRF